MKLSIVKYNQDDLNYYKEKEQKIQSDLEKTPSNDSAFEDLKKLLTETQSIISSIVEKNETIQLKETIKPLAEILKNLMTLPLLNDQDSELLIKLLSDKGRFENKILTVEEIRAVLNNIEDSVANIKDEFKLIDGSMTEEEIAIIRRKKQIKNNMPPIQFKNDLAGYVANRKNAPNIEVFFRENTKEIEESIVYFDFNFDDVSIYFSVLGLNNNELINASTLKGYCSTFSIPVNKKKYEEKYADQKLNTKKVNNTLETTSSNIEEDESEQRKELKDLANNLFTEGELEE